jgi:hypothetical protein
MDPFAHYNTVDTAGYTAMTHYRKFETYIPRKGIAGLSPNAHMHVSYTDITAIGLPILLHENMWTENAGNI